MMKILPLSETEALNFRETVLRAVFLCTLPTYSEDPRWCRCSIRLAAQGMTLHIANCKIPMQRIYHRSAGSIQIDSVCYVVVCMQWIANSSDCLGLKDLIQKQNLAAARSNEYP